ncbi:MAG: hypothetical protein AAF098_19030 [Pseudomonadota bacterium]
MPQCENHTNRPCSACWGESGIRRSKARIGSTLIAALLALSIAGCSAVSGLLAPPRAEFEASIPGESFSKRSTIETRADDSDIDLSEYARIGSVEATVAYQQCDSDVGSKGCTRYRDETKASVMARDRAIAEAKAVGGDIVVLGKPGQAESTYGSRNGYCQFTNSDGKCTRYERIRTRVDRVGLSAVVYRRDAALAARLTNAARLDAEGRTRDG